MRRRGTIMMVVAACLLLPAAARAAVVLDQYQEAENGGVFSLLGNPVAPEEVVRAQTFTAGVSGLLDRIDLGNTSGILAVFPPNLPPIVEIRDTVAGQPGATVLGSVVAASAIPDDGWVTIGLFSESVSLTASQMYAIVVSPSASPGAVGLGVKWDPLSYGGGALWSRTDGVWALETAFGGGDIQFRTYMRTDGVIPAPGAILLGALGAGLVGWLRRRRSL